MALRAPLDEKLLPCRKQLCPLFVRRDLPCLQTQPRIGAGMDQLRHRQRHEQKNGAKRDSLHHGCHLLPVWTIIIPRRWHRVSTSAPASANTRTRRIAKEKNRIDIALSTRIISLRPATDLL